MKVSSEAKATATQYLKNLGLPLSGAEIEKIFQGELVRFSIDTLTERELAAAFGALLQKTPDAFEPIFLESVGKEETDDSIQQLVTCAGDERLDFSSLKLLPSKSALAMVTQYVNPKSAGDLNLSADELKLFHALDAKAATVEQVEETLRKVLYHRLEEYRQKGLEGIAPYQRGKSALEPGKELLKRCEKLKGIHNVAPEFAKYITEYPNSKPTTGTISETFTWINFNIDDKPTISLVHKIFYRRDNTLFVVFHRHFYVSRGHNSVQAVGGGFPVDDTTTLLFFASRTSTDQVAGFGGSAKRVIGSRMMGDKLATNLTRMMEKLNDG